MEMRRHDMKLLLCKNDDVFMVNSREKNDTISSFDEV